MNKFEMVIFDCDGVLVDSERITNRLFITMIAEYGVIFTLEEMVQKYVGQTLNSCLDDISKKYNVNFLDDFKNDFYRKSLQALSEDLIEIPGISKVIKNLNIPYCVASNSNPDKITFMLEIAGIRNLFQNNIFSSVHVENPKPSPDVYLLAAKSLNISPENCLVIEDTPTGVRAGKAAGMTVYGYADLFRRADLINSGADKVFNHMEELNKILSSHHVSR